MDGIVRVRTIAFTPDRTPTLRRIRLGYEGDNLVERLEFDLPEITAEQTATLMITGADAVTLDRTDEGRYAVDLTREMIGPDGEREAYVRIDGTGGEVWQSAPMRMITGALPDVEEEIEKQYPTAVGQMLTAMAEHSSEMNAQEERVEQAAQRAEEAAEKAEAGGGSGSGGSAVEIDATLTVQGAAADAKAAGEAVSKLSKEIDTLKSGGDSGENTFRAFMDNVDVDYAFDEATGAYYTIIRVYRDRLDGKKQYPFVYAPNGAGAGTKTTYDLSTSEGWYLAINSGIFNTTTKQPDGIVIQNGVVLKNTPASTHPQSKPLTIDRNGNLGYAAYDADATELAASGIVSAVCGFMPIVIDYEAVPDIEWNSVSHYTENAQRQIVGQWGCGDYAIITCEGRGAHNSDGWTMKEAQQICLKHGLKFAYNLDGGGSTETMLGLKHVNTIYEGTTGRVVPTFIVFNGKDESGIEMEPVESEYTTLEYVRFTGGSYINTDVPESVTFGAEAVLSIDTIANDTGIHFVSAPNSYAIVYADSGYPLTKRCGSAETSAFNRENPDQTLRLAVDTPYTVSAFVDGDTYKWGNYETTIAAGTTARGTYMIGGWAGAPADAFRRMLCKCYSLKFYDSGMLTHNFVPSVRNIDGVVGLLETIEDRFYTSATAAMLEAGPVVS